MLPMEITAAGLKDFDQFLKAATRAYRLEQRRNMRRATNLLRNEVRRRVTSTFTNKSGVLRGSIASRVSDRGGELEGRIYIRKRHYYAILETGGTIRPKRKPYLVFSIGEGLVRSKVRVTKQRVVKGVLKSYRFSSSRESGGQLVKVRQVTIGAHPFVGPAFESKGPAAVEIVGRSFNAFQGARSFA